MQKINVFKKISSIFSYFVLLFIFLLFPSTAHAQAAPYVTLTSPNGGEYLTAGQYTPITWQSNSTGYCYLFYVTSDNPYMQNFITNTQAGSGVFYWQVTKPSSSVSFQPEKININCDGGISDSSDNYFYVTNPAPVCDKKAEVSFVDTSTPSIYRGGSVNNQFAVKNPNDPACGSRQYGLTHSYPGGWTMDIPYSVMVSAGETVNVPITVASSSTAEYKTYSYSVWAGDSSGGVLPGASANVTVVPRCDATVEVSLQTATQSAFPADSLANNLILRNPNPSECAAKTYVYSRSYPGGWSMNIQPNATVSSGQTVSVPFDLSVSQSAAVGLYNYNFWAYNSWDDGSGQAQVSGTVNVRDNVVPELNITSPVNNSLVPRRTTVGISASPSDNVGVTKVEFYVNGALSCTDTTSLYGCSFDTANRKGVVYNISAKAYDGAGNVSTTTSTVTTK